MPPKRSSGTAATSAPPSAPWELILRINRERCCNKKISAEDAEAAEWTQKSFPPRIAPGHRRVLAAAAQAYLPARGERQSVSSPVRSEGEENVCANTQIPPCRFV